MEYRCSQELVASAEIVCLLIDILGLATDWFMHVGGNGELAAVV